MRPTSAGCCCGLGRTERWGFCCSRRAICTGRQGAGRGERRRRERGARWRRAYVAPHALRLPCITRRRTVDIASIADRFMGLRAFVFARASAHCGRLYGRPDSGRALRPADSFRFRQKTQDNQTSRAVARRALGPGSRCRGEHTLARADGHRPEFGRLVHPRLYLINALVFGAADWRQRLTSDG